MKTEAQVIEGIQTGKEYIKQDCIKLSNQLRTENYVQALETLKNLNVTIAAIMAAHEILN